MLRRKIKIIMVMCFLVFLYCSIQQISGNIQELTAIDVIYDTSVTEKNPYRGFVPFIGEFMEPDDFPHSMEFFYVPLKNLMNGTESYTFQSGLEPQLEEIYEHHVSIILRELLLQTVPKTILMKLGFL